MNVAYRWFLGLEMMDKEPHFSTFGKNYTRRFKDTDLFEQIFAHILKQCYKFKLVNPTESDHYSLKNVHKRKKVFSENTNTYMMNTTTAIFLIYYFQIS